jgi:hypothetical protein
VNGTAIDVMQSRANPQGAGNPGNWRPTVDGASLFPFRLVRLSALPPVRVGWILGPVDWRLDPSRSRHAPGFSPCRLVEGVPRMRSPGESRFGGNADVAVDAPSYPGKETKIAPLCGCTDETMGSATPALCSMNGADYARSDISKASGVRMFISVMQVSGEGERRL